MGSGDVGGSGWFGLVAGMGWAHTLGMASATFIPVGEYLRGSYEPDAEYVDGRIEARPMGEFDHSSLQRQIMLLLSQPEHQLLFLCYPELRVRVAEERYRVPDLCLIKVGVRREQVVVTAPLLCVEILSPEDTMRRTLVRVRDFLGMGVREVWVVDPESRTVQVCVGDGGAAVVKEYREGELGVPGLPAGVSVAVSLGDMFRVLDEA
jgi:Uma2 family endonuclease